MVNSVGWHGDHVWPAHWERLRCSWCPDFFGGSFSMQNLPSSESFGPVTTSPLLTKLAAPAVGVALLCYLWCDGVTLFFWNCLRLNALRVKLVTVPTTLFLAVRIPLIWLTVLSKQQAFSAMTFYGLLVEDVSDGHLSSCQVSSVPHDCSCVLN